MLVMVLSAFPLSYFTPVITGSRSYSLLYHIHGLVFFAWIGLYAWQTHLVTTGRTGRHRELGLAGIAISTLMLPLGIALIIAGIHRRIREGIPNPYDNSFYNILDLATFVLLMIAGIAAVTRHVQWHRRFTYGAAVCLIGPAISRWFSGPWFFSVPPFPPVTDWAPNLTADLFLVALILYDRRTNGRLHPATVWMCLILPPIHLVTPFIAESAWWRTLAPTVSIFG
jgi:hypothetical protein